MLDYAQARRMMVDCQLRTFDVNDQALLSAMDRVPRELFVLPGRESLAYSDQDLVVSEGAERRSLVAPMVLARLIQALALEPGAKVLDVACGTGYSSAVMTRLGAEVVALEVSEDLAEEARTRLIGSGVESVEVATGPLQEGCVAHAPYDCILVNGAVEMRPQRLLEQLRDGGRLACVQGKHRSGRATLYVRAGNAFGSRTLFDAAAPRLGAFAAEPGFVF